MSTASAPSTTTARRPPPEAYTSAPQAGNRPAISVLPPLIAPPGRIGGRLGQMRFLKRQLSLPVSTISQWWVSRGGAPPSNAPSETESPLSRPPWRDGRWGVPWRYPRRSPCSAACPRTFGNICRRCRRAQYPQEAQIAAFPPVTTTARNARIQVFADLGYDAVQQTWPILLGSPNCCLPLLSCYHKK